MFHHDSTDFIGYRIIAFDLNQPVPFVFLLLKTCIGFANTRLRVGQPKLKAFSLARFHMSHTERRQLDLKIEKEIKVGVL
jgi:hypothetical protein